MTPIFHVGDVWEPEIEPEDPRTGNLVDPDELTVVVSKPDGTTQEYTVIKRSDGHYAPKILLTLPGSWTATATSPTGLWQGVEVETISVHSVGAPA